MITYTKRRNWSWIVAFFQFYLIKILFSALKEFKTEGQSTRSGENSHFLKIKLSVNENPPCYQRVGANAEKSCAISVHNEKPGNPYPKMSYILIYFKTGGAEL